MNITNKMLLLVAGVILFTLSGMILFHQTYIRDYLVQSQLNWVDTIIKTSSESISHYTINQDRLAVRDLLKRMIEDEVIEYAYVTDLEGKLFAHSFDGGFPRYLYERLAEHPTDATVTHFFQRYTTRSGTIVEYDSSLIDGLRARVHVGINQNQLDKLISSVTGKTVFIVAGLGFIGLLLAVFLGRKISQPLSLFSQQLLRFRRREINEFPRINTSDPEIRNLVSIFHETIDSAEKANTELQKAQQRLLLHRYQSPLAIIEFSPEFTIVDWNPAAEKIFGYTKDEVLNQSPFELIVPESFSEEGHAILQSLMREKGGWHSINKNITKDGREITCEWNNTPLHDDNDNVIGVASYAEDITHQQQQEEQLRRSQKMDALGKLTGGVAHDYNNMLGVVLGYAELLKNRFGDDKTLDRYTTEILNAGKRGVNLTRKLLAFSSQASMETTDVNLNSLLTDDRNMLEKTLTVRIKLDYRFADDLWSIHVDRNDLEDVILNMSINAMHAMNDSGQLSFITSNQVLSEDEARVMDLPAGDYVCLEVIDSGEGMDKETLDRIFEPFFSTKGSEGTGLGLSQVYGFIKRSGGGIQVYSEPGEGSRFVLYFPRGNTSEKHVDEETDTIVNTTRGSETILVVDDEPALQDLLTISLEDQGYQLFTAESAGQALDILAKEKIDLVISDIIMPGMDGYELSDIILQKYPDVKIQLLSGYNETVNEEKINQELNQMLMRKPVTLTELFIRIRELLD